MIEIISEKLAALPLFLYKFENTEQQISADFASTVILGFGFHIIFSFRMSLIYSEAD
jgi:hypothetical protein